MDKFTPFKKQLTKILDKYSQCAASDTPDFILAKYLISCLKAFEIACRERDCFYASEDTSIMDAKLPNIKD